MKGRLDISDTVFCNDHLYIELSKVTLLDKLRIIPFPESVSRGKDVRFSGHASNSRCL